MRWPATLLVPTVSSDRVHCSFTQQAAQLIDFPQRAEDVGCLGTSRPASPRLWSAQPAVILRLFWPGRAVAAGLRSGQLGGFHLTHFNLRRPLPPTCGCCAATVRPGRRTPAGGRPPSFGLQTGTLKSDSRGATRAPAPSLAPLAMDPAAAGYFLKHMHYNNILHGQLMSKLIPKISCSWLCNPQAAPTLRQSEHCFSLQCADMDADQQPNLE